MSIRVACPNGHVLNVSESLAGKSGLCPTCKARVKVPEIECDGLTEDAVLGILGPAKPAPMEKDLAWQMAPAVETTAEETIDRGPPMKSCEKCGQLILAATHICPYCHTYIGKLEDF